MTVSYMPQRGLPLLKNMYCDIWTDTAKLHPPKLGQFVVSLTVHEEDGSIVPGTLEPEAGRAHV